MGEEERGQQRYDSTMKALMEEQPGEMAKLFLPGFDRPAELSEEAQKPALRVDRVYQGLYKGKPHLAHFEFETDAKSVMPLRMLEYYGILYRKHQKPIIATVVCPFRTTIADPPLRITSDDEDLLVFHYRVIRLWTWKAQEYLEQHIMGMYALLPTMEGATYEVLSSALDEMKTWYTGEQKVLATHLLWFSTCLRRTDTISAEDKRRVLKKMEDFDSLLNDNPFVLKKMAEGKEEGLTEGEARGEVKGLQKAVLITVRVRFPALTDLVQEKIMRVTKPDKLDLLLQQVNTVPDEATARWLFDSLAA